MKLHEKIYWCRKKAGLSQDGLAEKLDVSRQAVSKWENGEAMPETAKLPALAKVFGVSIDWLLSEEDPAEEEGKTMTETEFTVSTESSQPASDWLDRLPGVIGKLAKRWGWLAGVYVAVGGAGIAGIGVLAKVLLRGMVSSFSSSVESMTMGMFPGGGMEILDGMGNPVDDATAQAVIEAMGGSVGFSPFADMFGAQPQMLQNNPVDILANVLIVLGLAAILGGILLAVWLRKWGKTN